MYSGEIGPILAERPFGLSAVGMGKRPLNRQSKIVNRKWENGRLGCVMWGMENGQTNNEL
jgi:hypothetical protein